MELVRIEARADGAEPLVYIAVPAMMERGAVVAFSTRRGGVSRGPYASLNLGGRGDLPENVKENRRRFFDAVGLGDVPAVGVPQLHGHEVAILGYDGSLRYPSGSHGADVLITRPGAPAAALYFADCTPVILFDPRTRAAAVVHAGWRGTVARVVGSAVAALEREFSVRPRDCLAAIGPTIGPCCYRVGEDVARAWRSALGDGSIRREGTRWFADLRGANLAALLEAGVPRRNIAVSGACTSCNRADFFSYRRDGGVTGRLCAVVYVPPGAELAARG